MACPRPLPTHLKWLRGNPGHRPLHPEQEPQPEIPPKVPDCPEFLVGYACDEWYRVAEELYRLKLLTRVDIHPLAAYCQAYATWRTAVETVNGMAERDPTTRGLMIKGKTGAAIQNPLVLTARQAANDMVRYAAEFGFTPAARSRIASADSREGFVGKFDGLLAS